MRIISGRLIWLLVLITAACSGAEPRLLNIGADAATPDEFVVLPGKPLQSPTDSSALPQPTPGGSNLTDAQPHAEVATALGGSATAVNRSGIPASDAGILAYTQRFGVAPNIRAELAAADLALRKRKRGLSIFRLFAGNRYFAAYRSQSLDQNRELARLRAAGVRTPSAALRTPR